MVAITYGVANVPASKNAEPARVSSPRQSIIGRLFTALMEARLEQAYRQIAQRAYLFDGKHGVRAPR